ncbi:coiled-coil and C2 domain-containing protein 2A [Nephila pilipes]|uniref:Coiled-coil and C2 domain-containing protein 2A n=1 Tax=Nephila pilipes TaxID=299642 RepID=A0A8X6PWG0_NEPPI|nr:coiled-coil and C2 domain-containing protein 2A [Nephila pilipes]
MALLQDSKIETTVEVTSEIPESLKVELRKKRKKLKERKAKSSLEDSSFDIEEIKPEPLEEVQIKRDSIGKLPKVLPKIVERRLPSPPQSSDDLSYQSNYIFQPLKPVPPPRKNKKAYELKELISLSSKVEEPGSTVIEENSLSENFNESSRITSPHCEETDVSDYDFFTRVWDKEEQQSTPCESSDVADGMSQDEADSIGLIRKELQEKLTGIEVVKHERASYTPFHIKIEKENNSFFHPSFKPVPVKMKLPEDKEPRNLEDEGFYVGKKPEVSKRNINRLENRLIAQKEFQWFGDDGLVKMLPDPVFKSPIRHVVEEQADKFPDLEYVKASLNSDKWKLSRKSNKGYQLDLDISSISFLHHPLFSSEHIIESRLMQMCDKHICNEKRDTVNVLKQKLKGLRAAASNLKQNMQKGMQETAINNERQLRLKQYQKDIRQTKRLRDLHEAEQKSLWKSILNTWEELKKHRQTQGFTSTSLNLIIQEIKMDKAIEKEEWERELLDELEEEIEDYEASSEKLFQEYESALNNWKQWNKAVKLAHKRQKLREKYQDDSQLEDESEVGEDLISTKLEDEKILSQSEVLKPKPVPKFNSSVTLEKLKSNALKMRRNPGEPILRITIDHDIPITPSNQCPRDEVQRRNAACKKKLYFKIMFNDKKVAETCERHLSQDFKAVWGQIFKIQIVHSPQSLRIEVLESGFFSSTHLAELYIPIPASHQTTLNSKLIDHQFSSEKSFPPQYNAIGSGTSYKFHDGSETFLLTNGILKCSLAWGVAEDNSLLVPSNLDLHIRENKSENPLSYLMSARFSNIEKLHQWIKKSNLDPHNPENAALFHFFQELGLEDESSDEGFECYRLEPLQDEMDFCSMEDIENNKRFQLLHLRDQDEAEFQNLRMIPSDEKNITDDMLELLHKRANENQKKESVSEEQREQAKMVMQKVREEVAKRFYVSQHQRMLEDIVMEEKVPSIGTIGFSLLKLFQTKRPLYPERKDRKKIICSNANMDVKIIIRILHASNVPVRKDMSPVKEKIEQKNGDTAMLFESQVQPFVEVMFQRTSMKTGIAEGPHPTWNQELELPFHAPNDNYTPSNLETVKECIYINLFDEVTVDLLESERERETVVYERLERRWLGNLKIPFTTLYLNSKIEGTFRINVPPVLLSYENEPRPWLTGLSDAASNYTYISFFMTIEPCLQLPEIFRDQFDSAEPEKVLNEVEKWRQSIILRFPDRMIKLMSVDLSGKWIFVTRFLRPLSPPEELLLGNRESLETMELLARFVSLIPTVSDSITFPGLCDIWSTSDQFLQMLTGDEEEHAILLCSYFLFLGKRSMLLLGSGIPEGPTAYVVTWESQADVFVWNSSTGDHFSVRDNHCPLQTVGCLISPDNVWANIQKNNHPSRINFDVSKSGDWKPFFSRSFPNPGLRSIQPSSLTYNSTDSEYVQELQENLKKSLKESIQKWRPNTSTAWNSNCNKILYKILTRLERNVGRTASDDSLQELEQVLKKCKVDGFPLTMPYTDIDAVIETVFATGVHLTEDKNAEFSVAVYIHAYPCCVLAVWVYVAVLIPRKDLENKTQEMEIVN